MVIVYSFFFEIHFAEGGGFNRFVFMLLYVFFVQGLYFFGGEDAGRGCGCAGLLFLLVEAGGEGVGASFLSGRTWLCVLFRLA